MTPHEERAATTAAHVARIEELVGQVERIAREVQEHDADRDVERAEAARRGDLGHDWQDVQRRIDAGRTTLAAVFTGEDESPAAERLREESRRRLTAMSASDDVPDAVRESLEDLAGERERVARLLEGGGR